MNKTLSRNKMKIRFIISSGKHTKVYYVTIQVNIVLPGDLRTILNYTEKVIFF